MSRADGPLPAETSWRAVGLGLGVGFGLALVLPDAGWLTRLAWVCGGFVTGLSCGGGPRRGAWHGLLSIGVLFVLMVVLGTLFLFAFGSPGLVVKWYGMFVPRLPGILLGIVPSPLAGAAGAVVATRR